MYSSMASTSSSFMTAIPIDTEGYEEDAYVKICSDDDEAGRDNDQQQHVDNNIFTHHHNTHSTAGSNSYYMDADTNLSYYYDAESAPIIVPAAAHFHLRDEYGASDTDNVLYEYEAQHYTGHAAHDEDDGDDDDDDDEKAKNSHNSNSATHKYTANINHQKPPDHPARRSDVNIFSMLLSLALDNGDHNNHDPNTTSSTASRTPRQTTTTPIETAQMETKLASECLKRGDMEGAIRAHTRCARAYRDIAQLLVPSNSSSTCNDDNDDDEVQVPMDVDVAAGKPFLMLSHVHIDRAYRLKQMLSTAGEESSTASAVVHRSSDAMNVMSGEEEVRRDNMSLLKVSKNDDGAVGSRSAIIDEISKMVQNEEKNVILSSPDCLESGNDGNNAVKSRDVLQNDALPSASASPLGPNAQQRYIRNPVDDMILMERELRDLNMGISTSNASSVASLSSTTYSAANNSSSNNKSSSLNKQLHASTSHVVVPDVVYSSNAGTAGVRARANRLHTTAAEPPAICIIPAVTAPVPLRSAFVGQHNSSGQSQNLAASIYDINTPNTNEPLSPGLESSWWGQMSAAGQSMMSSASSNSSSSQYSSLLASSFLPVRGGFQNAKQAKLQSNSAKKAAVEENTPGGTNTKQMLNLLDSLKTLSEENTALLKQIEEAKQARTEAQAVEEQMMTFKTEYGKRFTSLKAALDKFRLEYPSVEDAKGNDGNTTSIKNPVATSRYLKEKAKSEVERARQRERLIRKMDAELRKLKEESKKKDTTLKKYENFYKEVKARSAQKALEKQQQDRLKQKANHT